MKKVYQTRYGDKKGNCMQACVASLFELELDDVPDFCNETPRSLWYDRYVGWLQERGLSVVTLPLCETYETYRLRDNRYKDCYLIVSGKNSDGVMHSVIYRNGEVAHNPNRNCKGIKPEHVDIIFPAVPRLIK